MEHIRAGKHGARSTKQAIAIGLSKARRAGVPLSAPKKGRVSESTRVKAERDLKKGQATQGEHKPAAKRSRAVRSALKREGHSAASSKALSKQAHRAAAARKRRGTVTAKPRAKRKKTASRRG